MDAASLRLPSLPLIIIFLLGALALWLAIRIEVDKTIADLRIAIREFRTELKADIREVRTELKADIQRLDLKLDAINVRASEYELERARQRGMALILGRQTHTREPKSAPSDDA